MIQGELQGAFSNQHDMRVFSMTNLATLIGCMMCSRNATDPQPARSSMMQGVEGNTSVAIRQTAVADGLNFRVRFGYAPRLLRHRALVRLDKTSQAATFAGIP